MDDEDLFGVFNKTKTETAPQQQVAATTCFWWLLLCSSPRTSFPVMGSVSQKRVDKDDADAEGSGSINLQDKSNWKALSMMASA
jgi:hypothetical protein